MIGAVQVITAARAVFLAAMAAICLTLSPAKEAGAGTTVGSTVWVASGSITSSDSSACTVKAANPARGLRGMNENGPYNFAISVNAWLFEASCDGGTSSIEIRVHPDFTETEATSAAQKYGKDAGRLPKVLRSGVGTATGIRILSIHKGSHSWFGGRLFGEISIYTDLAQDKYDEEILVHEAVHVSLDPNIKEWSYTLNKWVISDPKWKAAQKADAAYISTYAKSNPQREDVAESFLAYFAARYVPSRISRTWKKKIFSTIPNRIAYFDTLLSASDMKPFKKVASVSIAADAASVMEGVDASFTLSANPVPTSDLTVNLTVADAPNADFVASGDQGGGKSVTIKANASSATYTVPTEGGVGETTDEPSGPVTVTVETDDGYTVVGANTASVTVNDNDPTTVTLAGVAGDISEGGTKRFTVTLGRGLRKGEILAVPLTLTGTATRNADYTIACPGSLPRGVACRNLNSRSNPRVTFTGPSTGTSATTVTLTLFARTDSVKESETVDIGLGTVITSNLGGGASATDNLDVFRINDQPVITISGGSTVMEGVDASFTVSANPVPTSDLTVNLTVADAPNADFVASGDQGGGKSVTIKANASSATYTVPTEGGVGETTDEPSGPVKVTVNGGRGYVVGSADTASVTVSDNDPTTVTLKGDTGAVNEGAAKEFSLEIGRRLRAGETLAVPLGFAGTATRGSGGDYTLSCARAAGVACANLDAGNAMVTFRGSAGGSAARAAFTLRAVSDGKVESNGETVGINPGTATTSGLAGGAAAPTGGFVFTINDPPPDPTVSFSSATYNVNEGSEIEMTVNITPRRTQATALTVKTGGTAESRDYAALNGTVTIAANASSATITVAITDDDLDEDEETLILTLSAPPTGVKLGTPSSATVTITDDDTAGVTVSKRSLEIREGGAAGTYTLKLDSDPGGRVSISVSSDDTTAVTVSPETVAFDGSDWSTPKTVQVTAEKDGDTTDETVNVSHSVTGYGWVTVPSVTVSVTDNGATTDSTDNVPADGTTDTAQEDVPMISVSSGLSFVTEGGDAVFIVQSTTARDEDTEVSLAVRLSGDFFSHGGEGQKTVMPAGRTSTEYKVSTLNDYEDESDGFVTVTINAGGDYAVSATASTATITVMDDDLEESEESSADRGALVAMYNAAGGDGWKVGWDLDAPIEGWHGVRVDEDGMVTGLYLSDNNLSGSIGAVLDEAEKLAELRHLYLNDNALRGEISSGRFTESGLVELGLWGNGGLAGEMAGDLSKMADRASLRVLYEDNAGEDIDGWFPEEETDYFSYSDWEGVEEMDGRVAELSLSGVGLRGEITRAIAELSSLVALDLSDNAGLEGELPLRLMNTELGELDICGSGIRVSDNEEFREWLGGIDFTDCEPAAESSGGGGCAVASGGVVEGAYQLVIVALAFAGLVWVRNRNWKTKVSSVKH